MLLGHRGPVICAEPDKPISLVSLIELILAQIRAGNAVTPRFEDLRVAPKNPSQQSATMSSPLFRPH